MSFADDGGEARYTVGMMLTQSESLLDDPIDGSRLNLAKVTSLEYVDIGYGLPANPPALPE